MKRNLFLLTLFAVMSFTSACKRLPIDPIDPIDSTGNTSHRLTGTSWELQGITMNGAAMQKPVNELFTLKFTANNHIEGTAACNGYGGDFKADAKNISFSNIISTMAYCGEQSLDQVYMRAMNSVKTYTHTDNSLTLVTDWGATLYFYPEKHVENPHSDGIVKFAPLHRVDFLIDPFQISNIKVLDETHIAVTVQYSGGCAEHSFALYADENIMPGNATDFVNMVITHSAHGDMCDAWLTKELVFDVAPLLDRWKAAPHSNDRLALQFSQSNIGTIHFTK
ncbi:MAG: META domain-containing protein [Bacteroidota bacterium]